MRKKSGTYFFFGTSLESRQKRAGYFFILPLMLGMLLIFLPTLVQSVVFCFNNIILNPAKSTYSLSYQGFKYFREALTVNPEYNRMLVSEVSNMVINVPIIVIFSLLLSVILNQKFKGRLWARVFFFLPVLTLTGIVAIIEKDSNALQAASSSVLIDTGIKGAGESLGIMELLKTLNFNQTLIDIIGSSVTRVYSIVCASGIQIFIFLAALQEVPVTLYEAAEVEGSSGWEIFWKITLPMISPLIIVNTVYTIVDTLMSPTNKLFQYTKWLGFGQNQFGLSSAMTWIYFLVVGIIIAITLFVISRFVFYND